MSLLVIVIPVVIFALILIVWSVSRLAGGIRRNQPILLKHCLGLFVSLTLLDLILCGYFFLAAGLGHSSQAEVVPLKCLLSFIFLVVCPVAGVLLYRYHRNIRTKRSVIVICLTVVTIIASITWVAAAMGGWPLLMYALRNEHSLMARSLIHAGVNINSQDRFGWTPIAYCTAKGDRETARLLLEMGADINLGVPLLRAAIKGDIKLVEFLLDNGANAAIQRHYLTPLMAASTRGNRKLVELLLDRGAVIDTGGAFGSALVCAAESGASEVVTLLIRRGADLNVKTGGDRRL